MKRTLLSAALVFFTGVTAFGQNQDQVLPPQQYPTSPTTAELGKYGDIPVNKYTGIPNISIPIYTIQTAQLSLPIGMSYHASGVKVDQMASWVGMNWSLNAGGAITRTVRGYPDEGPQGFLTVAPIPEATDNTLDYNYLRSVASGTQDAEPDLFNFNINGISGQFVLDQSGEVHMIPHQDINIDPPAAFGGTGTDWVITAIDGTKYTFGDIETSVSGDNTCASLEAGQAYTAAWYISTIQSTDGQDQIDFTYTPESETYYANGSEVQYDASIGGSVTCTTRFEEICTGENSFATIKLSSITFTNGKVDFSRSGGRLDYLTGGSKLDEIQIFAGNTLLKKHVLTYAEVLAPILINPKFDDHVTQRYRLFLDKVEEKDAANVSSGKTYQFEYDNRDLLPPRLSLAQDHWGFYNGETSNQHLIPKNLPGDVNDFYTPGGVRTSNFNFGKYGSLNKIIYPTGGETTFEYEAHDLANGNFVPGGIRIAKITNDAKSPDPNMVRVFDYADSATNVSTGIHLNYFNYTKALTLIDNNVPAGAGDCVYTQYVSNNYLPTTQGAAVVYTQVTESFGVNGENGKVHDTFSFIADISNTGGSPFAPRTSREFRRGLPLKTRVFKKEASVFVPVSETNNTYQFYEPGQFETHFTAVKALKVHQKAQLTCAANCTQESNYILELFDRENYYINSEWFYLLKTENREYSGDGSDYMRTTTEYIYHDDDADHVQPIQTKSTDAEGQVITTRTYYTEDNAQGSLIIKPIEVLSEKNGKTISGAFMQYDGSGKLNRTFRLITDGTLKPQTTSANAPTYFEKVNDIIYNAAGNIVEYTQLDGRPMTYLYGYNNRYVIAVFENATKFQLDAALTTEGLSESTIQGESGATLEATLNTIRASAGLSHARITTIIYDPLIGMVSQKDPSGLTQTFEYDNFLRLKLVRDHNGKIVSKNEYHFKGAGQ